MSRCIICGREFVVGDEMQAFIRCIEEPEGSWSSTYVIDDGYQESASSNNDKIKRRHALCAEEDTYE